jgi:hypothetical protein
MPSIALLPVVLALALGLSGCGIAGGERRTVQAREQVTVAGRACVLTQMRHEVLSINGTHAWIETQVTCGGRTVDCGLDAHELCFTRVATALAARA